MDRRLLYLTLILQLCTFCNGNDTNVEKKLKLLENMISGLQTFITHDMLLMKSKLAETDQKIERIFDRLDNIHSAARLETGANIDHTEIFTSITRNLETKLDGFAETLSIQTKAISDLEDQFANIKTDSNVKRFDMALTRIKRAFMKEKVILAEEFRSLHKTSEALKTTSKDILIDVTTAINALNKTHETSINNLKHNIETLTVSVQEDLRETVNAISKDVVNTLNDTGQYVLEHFREMNSSQTKLNNLTIAQTREIQLIHSRIEDIMSITKGDSRKLNFIYEITTMNNGFIGNNLYITYSGSGENVSTSLDYFYAPTFMARLANATLYGTTGVQGRLEVYLDNDWGTVCDYYFYTRDNPNNPGNVNEETVACRTLGAGFTRGLALPDTPFGQSTGRMVMSKTCDGNEDSLFECSDDGLLKYPSYCGLEREVHLRCFE